MCFLGELFCKIQGCLNISSNEILFYTGTKIRPIKSLLYGLKFSVSSPKIIENVQSIEY